MKLTALKIGTKLVCNINPEWGTWTVSKISSHDGIGWYDIKAFGGRCRVLSISEAERFWGLA